MDSLSVPVHSLRLNLRLLNILAEETLACQNILLQPLGYGLRQQRIGVRRPVI